MLRPVEEVHSTSRTTTTQSYAGVAAPSEKNASYVPSNFEEPKRTELESCGVNHSTAVGRGTYEDLENHRKSHTNYVNNRSVVRQPETMRSGFGRAIGAVIAPLFDAFKPTRKEEFSSNIRIYGDGGTTVPQSYLLNTKDTTPTTIKETTLYSPNFYMGNQKEGAYMVSDQQSIANQRDTTNCSTIGGVGGAASAWGDMSYTAAYNQHNNESKEKSVVSRTNHGNTQIYNQQMNVNVARIDSDRDNTRQWVPTNMPQMPIGKEIYGKIKAPQQYDENIAVQRISGDILSAFKSNPYTHSLTNSV